ncbi:MAG: hypothetical protein K2K24_04635, partial [Clostridia bacterium]|nr:hypothetical protein [Clostridia bacterium]
YKRVFASDRELIDYLASVKESGKTISFKYEGARSGQDIAARVAKRFVGGGGQIEYCVDATNTTYYFHW